MLLISMGLGLKSSKVGVENNRIEANTTVFEFGLQFAPANSNSNLNFCRIVRVRSNSILLTNKYPIYIQDYLTLGHEFKSMLVISCFMSVLHFA